MGRLGVIAVRGRGGLGEPVTLAEFQAGQIIQALGHGFGHGRAAAGNAAQAVQAVGLEIRAGEQVDHHGRNIDPARHLVARYQLQRKFAVPARHHHDAGAQVDAAVHQHLHAGDVEERHHGEGNVISRAARPDAGERDRAHERTVRVHAALGLTGRARGVGQRSEVVGPGQRRSGHAHGRQRLAPADDAGRGRRRGEFEEIRQRQVGGGIDVVGVIGVDDARQVLCREQRRDARQQFVAADRDPRPGIGGIVRQFRGEVHRIDRHHHRVGAQDGVIGDDELRAVLHVEQDAVAAAHAAVLPQIARERVRLRLEFGVAELAAVEENRGLARIACGRDLEVVTEAGLGQRKLLRHAHGPVLVVSILHVSPPGSYYGMKGYLPHAPPSRGPFR